MRKNTMCLFIIILENRAQMIPHVSMSKDKIQQVAKAVNMLSIYRNICNSLLVRQ